MKFFNPSGFKIEAMAGGKTYYFAPFSTGDVWDMDHARILIKKDHAGSKQGLVHLEYDDNMQRKFATFEDFKKDQAKNGLKNLYAFMKDAWINEKQAEIDIKHHKTGAEADKAIVDPSKFKEKLELVEQWQKDLEEGDQDFTEEKKPRGRRSYQMRQSNEQVANTI